VGWSGFVGSGEDQCDTAGMVGRGQARYGLVRYGRQGEAWMGLDESGGVRSGRHGEESYAEQRIG
jgi:hypothetical protein